MGDRRDEGPEGSAVYLEILRRLQQGEISADDRLVDTAIAAEQGVSRMPVREALLRLVHEGYLVGSTRGFVLPHFSDQDVADIFELRSLLEPRAAASAAYHLTMTDIADLEAGYRLTCEAVESGSGRELMRANSDFRKVWLRAVPNRKMATTITRFADHVQIVRRTTLHDTSTQQVVLKLLGEQLDAFRRRDSLAVFDTMGRFLDTARLRYFAVLETARLPQGADLSLRS
ncbi:GntR family transcriptional regulator [Novosphingobium sp. 1949]|uniref:GntR family transcriptional regulator n=1 Tax=Novosphingobium organovorum TaxID=2930092 RepID=A0ABT0BBJ3_9SPHN|nr:GntR family transcriptional regulator [Novosphingobium organovorum]MCJ2182427.1 GntR family transcriptional regulator [Novosphingobium organovorum]